MFRNAATKRVWAKFIATMKGEKPEDDEGMEEVFESTIPYLARLDGCIMTDMK